ncbi:efflux RND transporter periplasmic adaptor subunit [uncultured Neptuniibacter sp.]|uniref:efflux RND transporter periplasmic adaptor subunit n=1 Tax=uncultured Neptuniibacter sp. TaxID=502143 RepID=UPI00261094D8|nr:efflux RND transporter periplasmic adaptor subunit [uncultured Neptuniibacter sp.]
MNNRWILAAVALVIGSAGGYFFAATQSDDPSASSGGESQPLYWVAPMDPNFKRDKPGLSPMGMDLVPVYPEDLAGGDSPGSISISPEVTNNLGVRTAAAVFSPMQERINTVGYVGFDQEQIVDIHSRVSGWVGTLAVNYEGEAVTEGQLLYTVYSPELVNAQEEFVAAMSSGNRYLRQASEAKLKALGVATSQITELRKQRRVIEQMPVYAPKSGYISQLKLRQGMYIKPAIALMQIGPLDEVWVIAELFERQASQVKVGDQAEMELDFHPGKVWQGKVDYIYPALNPQTRTLKVRLRFFNPQLELKPDMFARVTIETQPTEAVLNVPAAALIQTGRQHRVVVSLGEGRYKSVEVVAGARLGDRVAIQSGLMPEDSVVVSAQFLLDSESSINSDFLRMTPPKMGQIEEVWVAAEVRAVDLELRRLVLNHDAIREWQQPSMVMEVPVDDALDLLPLQQASKIQVLLNGANMGDLRVTDYILPRPKAPGSLSGGGL